MCEVSSGVEFLVDIQAVIGSNPIPRTIFRISMTYPIQELTITDQACFDEALDLLNRTQGVGLFKMDYLTKSIEDPDSYVTAIFDENKIIAISIAKVIDEFSFYEPFVPDISETLAKKTVGSFSTLCVSEEYQGKGLGMRLSLERLRWLKERNCEVIVGVSWVSGKENNSARLFEKVGFEKVKQVDDFFYESSLKNPFICPSCGNPPCKCPAILYRLNII